MTDAGSWQTPSLREALARLEDAEVGLDRTILAAKQVGQRIPRTQLSEQDIQQIEEYARGKDAPRELRALQQRIDDGELSWQDIAAGGALDDPQVQRALSTGVEGMRRAYAMIEEGQDLDDIVEAGDMAPPPPQVDDDEDGGYAFNREPEG